MIFAMTESQLTEQSDYTKSGGGTPGDNVLGDDGELIITIPEANYPAGKTCTAQDADLVVGNIKYGVNIFGVEGTHAPLSGDNILGDDGDPTIPIPAANYPAGKICTAQDTDLVAGNIKYGVNIFGVEGTHAPLSGDNVLGDDGDPTIPIPAANYPAGKICTAQDADLVAGNIKDGVNIFGVAGTYVPAESAFIQSIQYGYVQIYDAAELHEHITSVDLTKTIIFSLGQYAQNGTWTIGASRLALTNATTITATRISTSSLYVNHYFMVVEFSKGVKSVQKGTIIIIPTKTSNTATIDTIDTTKSILSHLGISCNLDTGPSFDSIPHLILTNATTITARRATDLGTVTVSFMILEFN